MSGDCGSIDEMTAHVSLSKPYFHSPSPRRSGEKVPKADEGRIPNFASRLPNSYTVSESKISSDGGPSGVLFGSTPLISSTRFLNQAAKGSWDC